MMLVVTVLLIVAIYFLYHHFTKYNNYWKNRNVPGPEPSFFFGNIKDIAFRRRSTKEVYKEIYDKYPDEKVVGIFRMRSPDLLVKDLEIIKHILVKDFENFTDRDMEFSDAGLGANLFAAKGDTWRALRHRFTPIFSSRKLKNMMELISERANKLVEHVDKITREQPVQEVHGIMKKFTQACAMACMFDLDIDMFDCPYTHKLLNKLEPKIFINNHKSELDMMYPGILKLLRLSLLPREVVDFFSGLAKDVIARRNANPTDRNDFMDVVLGLKKAKQISVTKKDNYDAEATVDMTDDIIAGQIFIFYLAGYKPSSLTMSYMLYQLAINPDIQEKVVAEIDKVLQMHGGKLTYEAVADLKYMGQVFDETLRLYPVADTLRRRALADYRVPGTDLTVNKGQVFIISIPVIHLDANNYANPEIFDPERFSTENVALRHSCAYLPFGLGPRHCIAHRFAKLECRAGVARLLSAFRVEPTDQTPRAFQYETRIVMHPRSGVPLKLVSRR